MGVTCSQVRDQDPIAVKHERGLSRQITRTGSDLEAETSFSIQQVIPISSQTTTYVSALPVHNGKVSALQRLSKSQWYRSMISQGRTVIEDKQFQCGGYVRSVPKITDSTAHSTLLSR